MYGHMDKQPEMVGWNVDLGPWTPVLSQDKLYGRGGADDGYALYASLIAVMALSAGPAVWLPLVAGLGIATGFGLLQAAARGSRPGETRLPLAPFLAIPGLAFFGIVALP